MTRYDSHSDGQLISLLQDGDKEAFTEIYNRYWDKLFYKAGKKLNDLAEAEEVVQDLFLDLWQRRKTLTVTGELKFYLAAALKYRVINLQAKHRRAKLYALQAGRDLSQMEHSTEEWLAQNELQERLSSAIAALPEKCRLAFELRDAGLSQKQIAEKMQVSENTVKTHIGRALKILRAGIGLLFSLLLALGS
jgi:RNA polymerase sigma-70 factor (family 1)